MDQARLQKLDAYQSIIDAEKRTSRRASEVFFDMPPLDVAIEGERLVRDDLNDTYQDFVKPEAAISTFETDVDTIKSVYWEKAQSVPMIAGTYENATLDDYLKVDVERSEVAIRAGIRESYEPKSPPVLLLDAIEHYSASLNIDIMSAARVATMHLGLQLPFMKIRAQQLMQEKSISNVEATTEVFDEFTTTAVPDHLMRIKESEDSNPFRGMVNKVGNPDDQPVVDLLDNSPPLRLSRDDATGLTKVYKLERRPYTDHELRVANELARNPLIQATLISFQNGIVDFSKSYLDQHPERAGHSLLPFSEFFVPTEYGLSPNPKLLKVLCNNFLPALAGIMQEKGRLDVAQVVGNDFAEAAFNARDRRVFFAQIGKFNNFDPTTNSVELDAFVSRTCPGMQTLTKGLSTQIPGIFDKLKVESGL